VEVCIASICGQYRNKDGDERRELGTAGFPVEEKLADACGTVSR
jgi:hypothetical protein